MGSSKQIQMETNSSENNNQKMERKEFAKSIVDEWGLPNEFTTVCFIVFIYLFLLFFYY